MRRSVLFFALLALLISGCAVAAPGPGHAPEPTTAPPVVQVETPAPPVSTPTLVATSTLPDPTATATQVPTATVTPTPTPFPMAIQAMRARTYPGSDIVLEDELDPGATYRRYYASYLSDGLKIYGLLTVPNGDMPEGGWPAIVFNHGFIPPRVYRTTERYIAYVDRLARAGYIVFRIDYRGHDRSEGIAAGAYGDPGYTDDVLNAVAALQRFPQVNPQKIGMWGHSMGGFLTLRAMVISREIKAGVIWAGVVGSYSDMYYRWRRRGPTPTPAPGTRRWRTEWVERYGTPDQNPDFWNSVSSNAFLADLSGPVQLHHSLADSEVPSEFSVQLAEEIQAAGGSVELFTYEGDDHNLGNQFTLTMNRTIAFFDGLLK